jgi:hypothetical protein
MSVYKNANVDIVGMVRSTPTLVTSVREVDVRGFCHDPLIMGTKML